MENQLQQKDNNLNILLLIGIIAIALNLRAPITSIGPVIDFIRTDMGISSGIAGLLTTLPLLAFAFLSIFSSKLGRRIGNERAVLIALVALSIGILVRSSGYLSFLFIGTALIGIGIAICNVLLPGIVKQKFPHKVGLMTGVYTLSMGIGASIGAGLSIPITNALHGWDKSLAIWAVLSILAFFIWLPQFKNKEKPAMNAKGKTTVTRSLWRSPLAWQITFFMGLSSFLFYCITTWLPEILTSNGLSLALAGWMLSLMQIGSLPGSFFTPLIAERFSNQRGVVAGLGILYLIGLGGLLLSTNIVAIAIFVTIIGICVGAGLSLALTFFVLRTRSASEAADLSGMAQAVGYLLASTGPITIGFLFDMYQTWTPVLIILIILAIIFTLVGFGAGRNKYVLDREQALQE